jgi:hypothetical protein
MFYNQKGEALDQTGVMLAQLFFVEMLQYSEGIQESILSLGISALFAIPLVFVLFFFWLTIKPAWH